MISWDLVILPIRFLKNIKKQDFLISGKSIRRRCDNEYFIGGSVGELVCAPAEQKKKVVDPAIQQTLHSSLAYSNNIKEQWHP